jgi:putative addiction module component (TIGR02574 family)
MEDNIMTISRETLVNEALSLPPVERVAVIDRLLSSLDEPDQKLDALWAEEAEARLEAFERGDIRSVTLEEMLAKYRQTGC